MREAEISAGNSQEDSMNKTNSSNETKVLEYIKTNGEMTTGKASNFLEYLSRL